MTSMSTKQMIDYLAAYLPTQRTATPRQLLTFLRDTAIMLLSPNVPPALPVAPGNNKFPIEVIIAYALNWLQHPDTQSLSQEGFLTEIRNYTTSLIQMLPKWKCSMFFPAGNNTWDNNQGVTSSLNWSNISGPCSPAWRVFMYDAIVRNGGDTLLHIGEKMFNNPTLQAQLKAELETAQRHGIKRIIHSLKNDNQDFQWANMEHYILQMAQFYAGASDEQVAFMSCLESDEPNILTVDQCRQMAAWVNQYAPGKRFIVGSANPSFLNAVGPGIEKWLEIQSGPFHLSQQIVDGYIANLKKFIPFQDIWAGEFWDGSAQLSKLISKWALENGCAGVGSWVG